MPDSFDTGSLLVGVVVGPLLGVAVGGAAPLGGLLGSGGERPDGDPSYSLGEGGPSCYDGSENGTGGVHVVANGETRAATLDATILHPRGTEVTVNVTERPTGTYAVAFGTVEATSKPLLDGCLAATDLNVATALPEPTSVVTVDGRTIREVDREQTVGTLYSLPNPIDATG